MDKFKNKIINDDCNSAIKKIPDCFVDLTITSPPYDALRAYSGNMQWGESIWKAIIKELYRITKGGGIVVWVVGDSVIKGSETGSSFNQALHFKNVGFKLHDTMIYQKNGASFPARRDGNRYSQIFEYMFVFSKGKPKTANLICDKENKWVGHTSWGQASCREKNGKLTKRNIKPVPKFSPRNNIWKYNTGKGFTTKDTYAFEQPAMFPEQLVVDHLRTWSNEGDLVFDPFAGAGTTLKMAKLENRNYLGIEISQKYYELIKKRIKSKKR